MTDANAEGWNSPAADADWTAPAATDAAASATPVDKPQDEKPARRERAEREPEEEDNTLTLDQYLAQKKSELEGVSKLETRKVGDADWNDAVRLEKPEEEEAYFTGKVRSLSILVTPY